jgi:hypothetical protein
MCASKTEWTGRGISTVAAACMGALAVTAAYIAGGWSQQSAAAPQEVEPQAAVLSIADLEKAFWVCDYTATERGVDATPVDLCSKVTEDLKNKKFHGDFEDLTNWWRQNKLATHQGLREQERLTRPAADWRP